MVGRALQCLIFFLGLLFCSGTLVRVLYDGRSTSSSPADTLQVLQQKQASHVRIFDENQGFRSVACGNSIDVDLYLSRKNMVAISKSRALAVAWVQREVSSFIRCANLRSIVANAELMEESHLQMLLPALKAIDSALTSLQLGHSIKLSASFPLSFIEDCFKIPQKPSCQNSRALLAQVVDFLSVQGNYLTVTASCNKLSGIGDCLINLTARFFSVLPDNDLPLQIILRSPSFSSSSSRLEIDNKLPSDVSRRILAVFVEKPLLEDLESSDEKLFPSSHRELIGSKSHSSVKDVVTPTTTVPIINPLTPGTTPANPIATPTSPMTPTITPTTPTSPTITPTAPTSPTITPATPSSTPTTPVSTPTTPTTPMSTPTTPMTTPTTTTPSSSGSWCVASQSASETALQVALDYACGYGGADCSAIQQGGSCFNPDTVRDHASYAFNQYYQKNPVPTSCNFGGTAVITNTDPSTSTCQYPSSSTSSSVLNTTSPMTGATVFGSEPPSANDATTVSLCLDHLLGATWVLLLITVNRF